MGEMLLVTTTTCTSGKSKTYKYVALSSHLYEMQTTRVTNLQCTCAFDTFTMLKLIIIRNCH